MVAATNSKYHSDEFASYPTMQLPKFFRRFRYVLDGFKSLDFAACPMFWVGRCIRHKDCTLALALGEARYWGRRRWKNLDKILCFLFQIFSCFILFQICSCIIWSCSVLRFNITPSSLCKKNYILIICPLNSRLSFPQFFSSRKSVSLHFFGCRKL
jgi:hypothetical protein